MSEFPSAKGFEKKKVIMKKAIPVFSGQAATGRLASGTEFSVVCPDAESCEEVWRLLGMKPMDPSGLQKVILARHSDIELETRV
jgi:hypothetical protein